MNILTKYVLIPKNNNVINLDTSISFPILSYCSGYHYKDGVVAIPWVDKQLSIPKEVSSLQEFH
jgi:hypothetical protein